MLKVSELYNYKVYYHCIKNITKCSLLNSKTSCEINITTIQDKQRQVVLAYTVKQVNVYTMM